MKQCRKTWKKVGLWFSGTLNTNVVTEHFFFSLMCCADICNKITDWEWKKVEANDSFQVQEILRLNTYNLFQGVCTQSTQLQHCRSGSKSPLCIILYIIISYNVIFLYFKKAQALFSNYTLWIFLIHFTLFANVLTKQWPLILLWQHFF